MRLLSLTYFFGGIGTGVTLINCNEKYAMIFGGITLISKLAFEILAAYENTNHET
jgi:hypothetical protein